MDATHVCSKEWISGHCPISTAEGSHAQYETGTYMEYNVVSDGVR